VTRFGMSAALGPVVLEAEKQQWLGDDQRWLGLSEQLYADC
jgi:ATP-dependent Zn protease